MSDLVKFERRKINEWPKEVFLADFGDGDGCRPHTFIQYPDDTTPRYVRGDLHDAANARIDALEAEVARLHACLEERDAMSERMEAETARLREALEWYEAVVERCNSFAPEGAIARDMLAKDVGKKARAALKGDT